MITIYRIQPHHKYIIAIDKFSIGDKKFVYKKIYLENTTVKDLIDDFEKSKKWEIKGIIIEKTTNKD